MSEQKIDWTKPVQTRDGRKIRVLCTDARVAGYPIIGLVSEPGASDSLFWWTEEGRAPGNLYGVHAPYNAINVPESALSFPERFRDAYLAALPPGMSRDLGTANAGIGFAIGTALAEVSKVEIKVTDVREDGKP